MPSTDPRDRSAVAPIASYESWARTTNRTARTAPGRAGLDAKFERQVDPDRVLDPQTRARMVSAARSAHFARLARRSAQVRAVGKRGGSGGDAG